MPNPSKNRTILQEKLKEEMLDRGIRRRFSPLGVEEFIIPENLENELVGPGNLAVQRYGSTGPTISYKERVAYDPTTQTHERIHAGQDYLENKATPEQVLNAIQFNRPGNQIAGYDTPTPGEEMPAYEFSNTFDAYSGIGNQINQYKSEEQKRKAREVLARIQAEQQGGFNRYIDMMNKLNFNAAEPLEAAMPDQLIREYIKSHAQPLTAPRIIK